MKKILLFTAFAFFVSLSFTHTTQAQTLDDSLRSKAIVAANSNANVNANDNQNKSVNASDKNRATTTIKTPGNATSTEAKNNRFSTTTVNQGLLMSENHRSVVSTFVRSLLSVADREDGIGTQVRAIARAQNDSDATTTSAIVKIEERGSLRTFFFGSDYRSLGIIQRELASTTNNIARLQSLLSQTTSTSTRAELTIQINALEAEQARILVFINEHENIFSLFGWFNRMRTE